MSATVAASAAARVTARVQGVRDVRGTYLAAQLGSQPLPGGLSAAGCEDTSPRQHVGPASAKAILAGISKQGDQRRGGSDPRA